MNKPVQQKQNQYDEMPLIKPTDVSLAASPRPSQPQTQAPRNSVSSADKSVSVKSMPLTIPLDMVHRFYDLQLQDIATKMRRMPRSIGPEYRKLKTRSNQLTTRLRAVSVLQRHGYSALTLDKDQFLSERLYNFADSKAPSWREYRVKKSLQRGYGYAA